MSKTIKLSDEELKKLVDFQKQNDNITLDLGRIDIQKALLDGQRGVVLEKLADLQEKSNVVAKELQTKYGNGNIDLGKGEITVAE
tara:strand:- start:352 stop:606 length:255 start_codon:yes stop_codon:yes gene_type:complete